MPAPTKLTPEQITAGLKTVPEWAEVGEALQRTFQFKDFVTSMKFVSAVAEHAEAVQHHPDILIRYGKVTLTLATHDAGGITEKDFDSARRADESASTLPTPTPATAPPAPKTARKRKDAGPR